jgi:hypothetical protein
MFHQWADGNFHAYDAKTGDPLWQFQTGVAGGGGAAISYEIDGEQYVALSTGPAMWAFKLNGPIPPASPPVMPLVSDDPFVGPIEDTNLIETMSLGKVTLWRRGSRYFIDEFSFNPYRARVKVGEKVTWVNNGKLPHTIAAMDGSWTTQRMTPSDESSVVINKPGKYTYICKDHPWTYGQLIVENEISSGTGIYSEEQAQRGKAAFNQNCSTCHLESLAGNGRAPALIGDTFSLHWESPKVADLFERIRTTMPQVAPGSLDEQTYLDIVTFLLKSNGVPSGKQELKADSPSMGNTVRSLK